MFSCFRIQNVEENIQNNDNQHIPIIDTSENNDDAEMYNKVYNKLFLVSTEFSKIKQRIQNMEIKTNNNEIETIELKKELVYLKNDNNSKFINTKIDSINDNTVLFMSISNLTETKKKFIQDIQENTAYTNIVFGIDHKYSSSLNMLKEMMKNNNEVIVLDYLELIGKYTSKIDNFNGKWDTNPSKLGAYDWFTNSEYSYMWYIEDDVYSKNWDTFFEKYISSKDDLICKMRMSFPKWYYDNWKVGSKLHAIHLAHLYVHRVSKHFATCIIDSINHESTTSHHELYIPYVLYKYRCTHSYLNKEDTCCSTTNGTGDIVGYIKSDIECSTSNLFHPVKNL
tara:strand:+ start:2595 stop:3611 length:1017 start_codon:yes stop_codon:yes gene_type:complete